MARHRTGAVAVWRRWYRQRQRQQRLTSLETVPDVERAADLHEQPEAIIYDIEFDRYAEFLVDDVAHIVRLDADGFTDDEIAEVVGRTRKSVEYQLAKARKQARQRREREQALDQLRDMSSRPA